MKLSYVAIDHTYSLMLQQYDDRISSMALDPFTHMETDVVATDRPISAELWVCDRMVPRLCSQPGEKLV